MKIVVTGASGFIGSTLVPMLIEEGHEVVRMLRYVSGRYDSYDRNDVIFADLLEPSSLQKQIEKARPDIIINLAAQSAVAYSFKHPDEVQQVDYIGVTRLANIALEIGAILIHASTSEVYGRLDHVFPLTEDQPLGGTSPYAAAKVSAENYLQTLKHTSRLKYVIMRPFNTIGRAVVNNRNFVVERAITQAIETGVINLHDPRPLRDFIFRTDHAGAYRAVVKALGMTTAYSGILGEAFNVCTGDAWSIEEMAATVALEVGRLFDADDPKPIRVEFTQTPDRPLDIARLQGSGKKLYDAIGYKPRYGIAEAIQNAAIEWMGVLRPEK